MTPGRPLAKSLLGAAVVMLLATGCPGGAGEGKAVPTSPRAQTRVAGGTLNVLMHADFEHLDPARNYVAQGLDFGRLLYRSLTTYKSEPGGVGTDVVGDLATDAGTIGAGGTSWKFTLRPGLRYEDGTVIKAADVKYGVERAFDPELNEGPQYIQLLLANVPPGYQGPKKSGKSLSSIVVQGNTITFQLKRAVSDFNYATTEPTTVPVPRTRDTGVRYDDRVFSSGPYKIDRYERGKTLTLSRNVYWDRRTDPVRGAYPDTIVCSFGLDTATIDQRLIADSGPDKAAIELGTPLAPESIAQALSNAAVKSRSVRGLNGHLSYLAINTKKVPKLEVRQAINYAVNREAYRIARGGRTAGDYATTIMTPLLPGYHAYDLYKARPQGDPDKAKRLLQQAGVPLPLKLTVASSSIGMGVAQAVALQSALKRAGIDLEIQAVPPGVYYGTIGDVTKMPELAFSTWGPDWPSGSTVLPPQFDGRQIRAKGNTNLSQLNNPAINAEIDRISAIRDPKQQAPEWSKLDEQIMGLAPIVPLLYNAGIHVRGSKIRGAYLHAFYGEWDVVSLSVG
ncbi:MAG: ABC transporter substrate-binding protein [Pseudonocardiales bacterium]|nr:MAG: ABC transporter substrate-binding protein [Pseudonocardiales bacterium]